VPRELTETKETAMRAAFMYGAGEVFDRTVSRDGVPAGYLAMDDRVSAGKLAAQ
jgi:hypothetical protein